MPTTGLFEVEKSQIEVVRARGEDRRRKIMKRVMIAEMEVRRPVGKPRTRWKDVLQRDLASNGLRLGEAAAEARDCDGWRAIVRASCDYSAAEN